MLTTIFSFLKNLFSNTLTKLISTIIDNNTPSLSCALLEFDNGMYTFELNDLHTIKEFKIPAGAVPSVLSAIKNAEPSEFLELDINGVLIASIPSTLIDEFTMLLSEIEINLSTTLQPVVNKKLETVKEIPVKKVPNKVVKKKTTTVKKPVVVKKVKKTVVVKKPTVKNVVKTPVKKIDSKTKTTKKVTPKKK